MAFRCAPATNPLIADCQSWRPTGVQALVNDFTFFPGDQIWGFSLEQSTYRYSRIQDTKVHVTTQRYMCRLAFAAPFEHFALRTPRSSASRTIALRLPSYPQHSENTPASILGVFLPLNIDVMTNAAASDYDLHKSMFGNEVRSLWTNKAAASRTRPCSGQSNLDQVHASECQ